jgi:hypothetical protein
MAEKNGTWIGGLTVAACLVIGLNACSSGGGGTSSTTGGTSATTGAATTGGATSTTTGGGATTGGAASGTTGGGPTTSGGTAGKAYSGSVILANISASVFSALAAFEAFDNTVCPGGTQLGNCCYEPPPSSTGGTPTPVSAGKITLADNGATIGTMDFSPGYVLSSETTSTLTWAPGDSLNVSAAGATVDAFEGTVTAPGLISGVNPSLSSTITIPLASDWSISWTPDTLSGDLMIVNLLDRTLNNAITCSVQDSVGTVTFPATLLANFNTADTGRVALSRSASTAPSVGNADVEILVGVDVAGPATFQ